MRLDWRHFRNNAIYGDTYVYTKYFILILASAATESTSEENYN